MRLSSYVLFIRDGQSRDEGVKERGQTEMEVWIRERERQRIVADGILTCLCERERF